MQRRPALHGSHFTVQGGRVEIQNKWWADSLLFSPASVVHFVSPYPLPSEDALCICVSKAVQILNLDCTLCRCVGGWKGVLSRAWIPALGF